MTITIDRKTVKLDPDGCCAPRRLLAFVGHPWPAWALIQTDSGESLRLLAVDQLLQLRGGEVFRTEKIE